MPGGITKQQVIDQLLKNRERAERDLAKFPKNKDARRSLNGFIDGIGVALALCKDLEEVTK